MLNSELSESVEGEMNRDIRGVVREAPMVSSAQQLKEPAVNLAASKQA